MTMTPGLRKLALTAHVTAPVGWLGAVAAYLALALAVLTSPDGQRVRAAYLAMELTVWYVIVPLAFASLLTGVVSSLGTSWGLFRHYWVLFKFLLNVLATLVLLLYTKSIGYYAGLAESALPGSALDELRHPTHAIHSGAALLVLLVATVLAVYKPRGVTPYGWRRQQEQRVEARGT
ncbi:hypothetical protein [Longimicrobium sp.]|uniref:hypothetical protein n=1 Tax=Longimicrobium sp. TaxID=2029185 RepID=UPI002E327442|nr:hypothetical protein [Longimicrobium sp.]HEX6042280.1 hypothetical protein [Longimicrobium sp.]